MIYLVTNDDLMSKTHHVRLSKTGCIHSFAIANIPISAESNNVINFNISEQEV